MPMNSLTILLPDSPGWALHSAAPQPPLESLRWLELRPSENDGEVIECALLGLRGAGIREWLEGLEAVLSQVRGTPFARLEHRAAAGDEPLYAALRDGWLEADPLNQSAARGAFTARLYLRRSKNWRKTAAALPLSNANGSRLETGLTLFNHSDGGGGHQNFADIAAGDLRGGLPAPLSLRVRLLQPTGETLQRLIIAAGSRLQWGGEAFPHALEGEAALPGADCTATSLLTDATASGAAYRRVQWTRPDSAALLRWSLSPLLLGFAAGRAFRSVLRLASPPPAGVYLRWRLLDTGGHPLEESPPFLLQPQSALQVGAALHLPPRWQPHITPAGLALELHAESRDSSPKTLDVDFFHLLPAEGWLELNALNGASAAEVWLDGENRLAYTRTAAGEIGFTHTLSGAGAQLMPGNDCRLYLLWETESGAPPDGRCEVQAFYAPRVNLP